MEILLQQVQVIDRSSSFHLQTVDIYIKDGLIKDIGRQLPIPKTAKVWHKQGACVSVGWMDVGTQICDPGYEHREDLNSIYAAALAGGYTALAPYPNTYPTIHSKSEVQYLLLNTQHQLVDYFPIGSISENAAGKQLAEMYDMYHAGAIAFSDGDRSMQHGGLLMRALLYAKSFNGFIINQPFDTQIVGKGYMHEGEISTQLGLRGIPTLAEEIMVQRDLYLLEYTDSHLHLANISCAKSVVLIRVAKAKGLKVTASVNPMNLIFEEEVMRSFDSNYKVLPPIRTASDRLALIDGLKDGTIDFIQSNHIPHDVEAKNCEFIYAKDGVTMLETAFPVCMTHLSKHLSLAELIPLFASHPRKVFHLPTLHIEKDAPANLTIFHPTEKWKYLKSNIRSKSHNSPFIGQTLEGRVLGVINGKQAIFH